MIMPMASPSTDQADDGQDGAHDTGEGGGDPGEGEQDRRRGPDRLDELPALVACGGSSLLAEHVLVQLPLVDHAGGQSAWRVRGGGAGHGRVIRVPNSFFHSS